ncbi:hypothetical protein niasHT_007867 [Heterodera trifolii]|uniref:Uncharacterized protein n=1 Tax=Heterodera trifolii TaxID=157864 RepID=A0ABD2LZ92_9BILA
MNSDGFLPSSSTTTIGKAFDEKTQQIFSKILKARKADSLNEDSEEALQRKLTALQHEERALLSLISRLRSHQRTLQLEKARLDKFYEESIKKEMFGTEEDKRGMNSEHF